MSLTFSSDACKEIVFQRVHDYLTDISFNIVDQDQNRPWGGFYVVDETQSEKFIRTFFPNFSIEDFKGFDKLSPKILLVAPLKRLSWQYHHRRAELWKVVGGSAGIVVSDNDVQTDLQHLKIGEIANLKQGQRHRLVGMDEWGIIAEIWKHTDPENPSDEDDIVRVSDDFGR